MKTGSLSYWAPSLGMTLFLRLTVGVVLAVTLCLGCSGCVFNAISRDLVGPYRLLAVDDPEELALLYDSDGSGGFGRIDPTVIEVGWNDRYLVAARRPFREPGSELHYYYLDMTKDHDGGFGKDEGILFGPFTEVQFEATKAEMGLPEFTVHYPKLR